jgi:hypothetical protein
MVSKTTLVTHYLRYSENDVAEAMKEIRYGYCLGTQGRSIDLLTIMPWNASLVLLGKGCHDQRRRSVTKRTPLRDVAE